MSLAVNIVFPDGLARVTADIKNFLPKLGMGVVFDVGANLGQTVRKLRPAFPEARLLAFEPVSDTFAKLSAALGGAANVELHRIALGPRSYQGQVTTRAASTTNMLTAATAKEPTEPVDVLTGDRFCKEHGIADIQFLKIDTEGHDFDVLRGFPRMLLDGRIDLIQIECSMNPKNRKHVPLELFRNFLEPMGYSLFGLYDQVQEFRRRPVLRRCDAVFISERCAEANTLG